MDVADWLRGLGLERYEPAFRDNEIDAEVLPELTEADLEKLGLPLGPRKKLLKAIAGLSAGTTAGPIGATTPPPRSAEAERRQLTVMFVDLIGSTALSAQLDPEEMGELIRAYQNTVAGEITRYEGHLAKFMGDGVLAYFGWPRAYEDAAERAVRAGLAIAEAVRGLRTPAGDPLAARVGVATGLVVVGELIGSAEATERAVVGETPNLAARLQALAGAMGGIVVGENTRRLLGGLFELEDLGTRRLRGFAAPVRAFRVTAEAEGAAESRFQARQAGDVAPMIGREQELALLLDRWRQAKGGEGQAVLLVGEAGIGKSRITQAVHDELDPDPHFTVRYQCSPYHSGSALWPVIQQLRHAAGLSPGDDAPTQLDRLEALLRVGDDDAREAAPLIAALLGIDADARYAPLDLTAAQQRARTLDVLIGQLVGLARRQPVLCILEDAHWIDPTTQELIDLAVDRIAEERILLLVTARPVFQSGLGGHPHVTRLTLNRLGREHAGAIVTRLTRGKRLPEEVLQTILSKTDGVPLFVEELTKAVLNSGLLRETSDAWVVDGPLPPLAVPASLHDSLLARLDRLQPAKEVAQTAACIGREFDYGLLAAVSSVGDRQLEAALQQLGDAELIFRRGRPPNASYVFKHALLRDAAYESLLRSKRSELHARILAALKRGSPDAPAELLAHHATEAGVAEEAVLHWSNAGRHATRRSAVKEALAHLRRGLAVLSGVADEVRRNDLELDLQISLAAASIAAHGYGAEATERAYDRARQLVEGIVGDPRRFAVLYGLFVVRWNHAKLAEALGIAREMLRDAERAGDVAGQCVAHRSIAVALNPMAEFAGALEHARRAVDLYDPAAHADSAYRYGHDIGVAGLMHVALAAWHLGRTEEAEAAVARAEAVARGLGHANTIGYWYLWATHVRLLANDHEVARRLAAEMVDFADERFMAAWSAWGRLLLGCAHAVAGDAQAAIATLNDAMARLAGLRISIFGPTGLGLLAAARALSGDPGGARDLLTRAVDLAVGTGERWFEPEILRLRGEVLGAAGKSAEAEAALVRSIGAARNQGSRWYELRAATALARLRVEAGDRRKARDLLAPVYGRFTEGFDTPDLKDAKALLDGLR